MSKYGNLIVYRKGNDHINVSQLCNRYNKSIEDWLDSPYAIALMKELNRTLDQVILITIEEDLVNDLYIHWAHPALLPHIAAWLSPEFAVKVSGIVNFIMTEEHIRSHPSSKWSYQLKDTIKMYLAIGGFLLISTGLALKGYSWLTGYELFTPSKD